MKSWTILVDRHAEKDHVGFRDDIVGRVRNAIDRSYVGCNADCRMLVVGVVVSVSVGVGIVHFTFDLLVPIVGTSGEKVHPVSVLGEKWDHRMRTTATPDNARGYGRKESWRRSRRGYCFHGDVFVCHVALFLETNSLFRIIVTTFKKVLTVNAGSEYVLLSLKCVCRYCLIDRRTSANAIDRMALSRVRF